LAASLSWKLGTAVLLRLRSSVESQAEKRFVQAEKIEADA
jgi:hypothetical protein